MSAVAASGAQAQEAEFTAAEYPAVGTGSELGGAAANFLEATPGSRTHCANVTYEGTLEGPSKELTVTPHYTNCSATTGGQTFNATIRLNTCAYVFSAGTVAAHGGSTGSVRIECPAGKQIEVTVATCRVDVGPQTLGGKAGEVTFTNEGNDVKVDVSLNSLTATDTDAIFCPFEGHSHITNGVFQSTVTFQGFEDLGTHNGVTVDDGGAEDAITTATEGSALKIDVG
jgi:hypothetical protein